MSWIREAFWSAPQSFVRRSRDLSASATTAYVSNVRKSHKQLRASAIEPRQIERMPAKLRNLDWEGKPSGRVDAAAIVRKLHGNAVNPESLNELGCAYALLAWELTHDDYWRRAVAELRAAKKGDDAAASGRASANLAAVSEVSGFGVEA